jgi:pyridoxal/pyridoxine/pyridoxamine kinase
MNCPSVLSVSSRVCLRRVGNSVLEAAFSFLAPKIPLYTLDTIQWTAPGNHPQRFGITLPPDDLYTMLKTLMSIHFKENKTPLKLVIGYLRTPEQVDALVRALDESPAPESILLDPILGDNGKLYVEETTARAIRTHILPRANYLVPNLTEAIFLSHGNTTRPSTLGVDHLMNSLLDENPQIRGIAVTSAPAGKNEIGIYALDQNRQEQQFASKVLPGHYSGTGDCYTGALAAILAENPTVPFLVAAKKAHQITVRALEAVANGQAAILGEALGQATQQTP